MAVASNDRKISQLPIAPKTEPDTNFLVVTGINTTPSNERITLQNLFGGIPSSIVVGEEGSGHTVVFNASDDPTHRFVFVPDTGDVVVGHDLVVANDLMVSRNLSVAGTTTFANPIFIDLEIRGTSLAKGTAVFEEAVTVQKSLTVSQDINVGLDMTITNNLDVNGSIEVANDSSLQDVTAKSIEVSETVNAISFSANTVSTVDLDITNQANTYNLLSTGFIQTYGNVIGVGGKFDFLEIQDPSTFHNSVTVKSLTITENSVIQGDESVQGNLGVSGNASATVINATQMNADDAIIGELDVDSLATTVYTASAPPTPRNGEIWLHSSGGATPVYSIQVQTPDGVKSIILS